MKKLTVIAVGGFTILFAILCLFGHFRSVKTSLPICGEYGFTLIIDAGHGGVDGGASTAAGVKESLLNLDIALRAEDLSAILGIAPKMIRSEDISIHSDDCKTIAQKKVSDLKNRVAIINDTPNAILLSIHQNHFSEEKYSGAQVFYGENEQGKDLADNMQEDFRSTLDAKNMRKSKRSQNVYLMQNVDCPAVLIECGFLSNYREAELLQNSDYQKKLAMVMLRTIAMHGKVVTDGEI